jgi:DegV family protein with EDD domain
MDSICLLTDGSAQYAANTFRGSEHIYSIYPDIRFNNKVFHNGQNLAVSDFPDSAFASTSPHLVIPDVAAVCQTIDELSKKYNNMIAILSSRSINPLFNVIERAVQTNCGKIKGQLINSQAVSAGLGYLLEKAAGAVMDGLISADIEHIVRRQIPHVYTTLCSPGWSYLHNSGLVDHSQAEVGEMMALYPIFTLEDGGLAPIQKVKADHSIFEYFQEFLDEFEELDQITFLHHEQIQREEIEFLREHVHEMFPQAKYTELKLNPACAAILGPRTTGLTVIEKTSA